MKNKKPARKKIIFFKAVITAAISLILFAANISFADNALISNDTGVGVNTQGSIHTELEVDDTLVFVPVSSPASSAEGSLYYDSDTDTIVYKNNSAWNTLGQTGGKNTVLVTRNISANTDNRVECPDGYVVTGIQVGLGTDHCPNSCNFFTDCMQKVQLYCSKYE
ncbi:MAG: hypothetical protein PHP69_07410 [Candidatus Omnitrophica bacterium]|nr:hypothetical protein [Candidatus Omnitrophota bacterium]MDD5441780.1 hypothetical protein [Candidatus Omnitrophota bacterium]